MAPLPAPTCVSCSAKSRCPQFDNTPGAECWYVLYEAPVNLETGDGILELMRHKVSADYARLKHASRLALMGAVSDDQLKALNTLSKEVGKGAENLLKVSIALGAIKPDKEGVPALVGAGGSRHVHIHNESHEHHQQTVALIERELVEVKRLTEQTEAEHQLPGDHAKFVLPTQANQEDQADQADNEDEPSE